VLDAFPQIYMSADYGVKIPNTDGRAGMAAIVPLETRPEDFDFRALTEMLRRDLPEFAIPRFIRFKEEIEQTPSMKFKKSDLKQEGYDLEKIGSPVYVLLPGKTEYARLTAQLRKEIDEGKHKL